MQPIADDKNKVPLCLQEEPRRSRARVALRGLFWGAIVGGVIGYVRDPGDISQNWVGRWGNAAAYAVIGAPVGMVVFLLLTPL
jgi:hypothetical protein